MSDRVKRNLPLVIAAPLLASTVPVLIKAQVSPFGLSTDLFAGFVAGVGIGLGILGLIRIRRAG